MVLRGHRGERPGERIETGVPSNAFMMCVRQGNVAEGRFVLCEGRVQLLVLRTGSTSGSSQRFRPRGLAVLH